MVLNVTKDPEARRALIVGLMRENSEVTISEMSQKTGVTTRTIKRDIESLVEKGVVLREGGRKEGFWKVLV